MLKKILIGLAAVILIFVVVVAMQPADFTVTRSATIAAPPTTIFPHVNDFHNFETWSPWAKLDPEMKTTHSGAPAGTGAVYAWTGNNKVGEGRMTIEESRPNERVLMKLEFLKPFAATNSADFTFTPVGDQTRVTWTMNGKNNFVSKAMCLFMDMDKMVGGDFEKGLASLKTIAEAEARTQQQAQQPATPVADSAQPRS